MKNMEQMTEKRRMYWHNHLDEYFYSKIQELLQMGEIQSVAMHTKNGNPYFGCEYYGIRIEDVNGEIMEMVIHHETNHEVWEGTENVLMNLLLVKCQVKSGLWVGVNCDLKQAIDFLRECKKYTGEFLINGDEENTEYIF